MRSKKITLFNVAVCFSLVLQVGNLSPSFAKSVTCKFEKVAIDVPESWGEMKGSKVAAVPQDTPGDNPDGADPEHYELEFSKNKGSVDIFFVKGNNTAAFKRKFPAYAPAIADLKKLTSAKPAAPKEIPHLPWGDVSSPLCAHVGYPVATKGDISYVRSLQHFQQDDCELTNQDLVFYAQGYSKDGNYYVSMQMPIRAPKMQEKPTSDKWSKAKWDEFSKKYKSYSAGVNKLLDGTADGDFSPTLPELDGVLKSIPISAK